MMFSYSQYCVHLYISMVICLATANIASIYIYLWLYACFKIVVIQTWSTTYERNQQFTDLVFRHYNRCLFIPILIPTSSNIFTLTNASGVKKHKALVTITHIIKFILFICFTRTLATWRMITWVDCVRKQSDIVSSCKCKRWYLLIWKFQVKTFKVE